MPKLRVDQYLSILLLSVSFLFLPSLQARAWAKTTTKNPAPVVQDLSPLITQLSVPIYTGTQSAEEVLLPPLAPKLVGKKSVAVAIAPKPSLSIYIMDRQSGTILYQKNATQPHYPASTAKMMTALVAKQAYPLDKIFTVKEEAFATGSTAHFQLGENLYLRDLLYALLIPSGNDAAFVLANNYPTGYQGFVDEMNQRARLLHLDNSKFRNPSGLDTNDESSTARDLAILANEVMKDPLLRQIVGTKETTIHDVTGQVSHQLQTTQELLGVVDGVVGIKTGTTPSAGENLITEVDRDGHQVVFVVLGSTDRFKETRQLIDWVFANYQWKDIDHASPS